MSATTPLLDAASLPFEDYRHAPDAELDARIEEVRRRLGDELLILGHHYQQDEVIRHADLRGDSLKLSQLAAESRDCRAIVFCGVHFMAETADILSRDDVTVHLPDMTAGCSMADMADLDSVEAAWSDLAELIDVEDVTPVTYINSTAELKAFCGRHGGIVCTSSNARKVLDWAFANRRRALFFPDQHLGRNTARAMGVPLEQMPVWDPRRELGGNSPQAIEDSRVILWRGHCSVHQMFKPAHVAQFRKQHPGIQILVHPECSMEVVEAADLVGSTEYILKTIAEAPAGSSWAVGTELHLVNRLAAEHPDKAVHFLSPMVCMCSTMYRIDLPHLAWCLDNLTRGTPVNRVQVPEDVKRWARTSLQRMLDLG
ncbi:quinolinate synthase NadA [Paludisphaera soli]|uniref:quinolinate synthase NadA n=1 Tax=Paludisphaera soli TaxID=2712865 RepID=UPI0013EC614B|nr:quinolinate synthase NadA [Paludisphaera soli]